MGTESLENAIAQVCGGAFWIVIVALVILLVVREVVTWYWKINTIVALLKSIDQRLHWITQTQYAAAAPATSQTAPQPTINPDEVTYLS